MTPEERLPQRYLAATDRYERIDYRRCGRSGLKLPALSLGLWHNFSDYDCYHTARGIVLAAFDAGVTHFDLANNYGPPYGSAEENFGKMMRQDLAPYRDEIIVSTKAGYDMWPGPYGDNGSRKYLTASLDQSLRRMSVDYVDVFYHHRPDPDTPLEETMGALATAVQRGKALYAGVSNYPADRTREAARLLREMGCPLLIHQPKYSLFDRWVEGGLLDVLAEEGVGCIPFSPLAQGMLTSRYLNGVPADSRAAKETGYLGEDALTDARLKQIHALNDLAQQRGQSLAQMALAWLLKDERVTTVLIGASSVEQLHENLACREQPAFGEDELRAIEAILAE